VLDRDVYRELVPDWRASQQKDVEDVCAGADTHVWMALDAGATVGFIAVKLDAETRVGEIYMVAVDPDAQGRGMGAALGRFALDWMKGWDVACNGRDRR
jgi:GNAT superfamily N-acetyltransferase